MLKKIAQALFLSLALATPALAQPTIQSPTSPACEVSMLQVDEGLTANGLTKHRTFSTKPEINLIVTVLGQAGIALPEDYKIADQVTVFINPDQDYAAVFFSHNGCAVVGGRIPLILYAAIISQMVATN